MRNTGRDAGCCFTLMLLLAFMQHCGSEMPPEYRALFRLSSHEREAKFKEFPMAKQVDAYVYAMYVEPPLTEFVDYLASNGKRAVPDLLSRLEVEKSDTVKGNLVYVFKEMHEYHVSLRNDEATIKALERTIGTMTDDYHKKRAEEYLATIKSTPGVDNKAHNP